MSQFTKVAITLPTPTFEALERTRGQRGMTRSAAVAMAVEDWLRSLAAGESARRYVEGYLRQPETVDESATTAAFAAVATADWGPWPAQRSSRAAESGPRWPRTPARRRAKR